VGIPKQRPKSLFASFLRPDGSEVVEEYSSKDQPYVLLMPIWNVPGIALGKPPTADFDVTQGEPLHLYFGGCTKSGLPRKMGRSFAVLSGSHLTASASVPFQREAVGAGRRPDKVANYDARKRTTLRWSGRASIKDRCRQAYGMAFSNIAVSSSGKSI
jgi:hypothetical protein